MSLLRWLYVRTIRTMCVRQRTVGLGLLLLVAAVSLTSHTVQAQALPGIPATVAPAYVANAALAHCADPYNYFVYQTQWLSPQGSPSATSINVPYGTTSVPMQLNWLSYRCKTRVASQSTTAGTYNITASNPNIPPIVGQNGSVVYVPVNTLGYRSGTGAPNATGGRFNYATTPLIADQTINISLTTRGTKTLNNGESYLCAVVDGQTTPAGTATSATDFGNCLTETTPFAIDVYVTAPTTMSCTISISPAKPAAGQTIIVKESVSWSGSFAPSQPNYKMNMTGTATPASYLDIPYAVSPGLAVSSPNRSMTLPVGVDTHTISGSFTGPGISPVTCSTTFTVTNATYMEINGGDIAAGASFATGTGATEVCAAAPTEPKAGIVGWNDNAPGYGGAGGQFGAFALSIIQDFVTNQGNGKLARGEPNGLTFANRNYAGSVNKSAGKFGGMFGTAPCVDYWAERPSATTTIPTGSVSGWSNGVYNTTSDRNIGAASLADGANITLFVKGDVAITGNITYLNHAGWTSRSQIPSFRLIVQGSIYIAPSVTKLDGLYAAIPASADVVAGKANQFNAPNAGTISTCSQDSKGLPFTTFDPNYALTNGMFAACSASQLVFTGSVSAQQLWLLRSFGGVSTGQPAEIFNYRPETWLSNSGSAGLSNDYQSIIGLPPVL